MKIIYARMPNYDWVSTPSDAVVRAIEKLGHRVYWLETVEYLPVDKVDFVFSPYESVTILGDAISKLLGEVPHYAHIEVLPPWRVVRGIDYQNYGLEETNPEIHPQALDNTIPHYLRIGKIWKNAQVKSVSNKSRIDFHHKLLGKIDNLQLRYPSIDTVSIDIAKAMYSPKRDKNKVITIGRAMPIKRYDLLCNVMNEVKSKVKWTIIGDGPMIEKLGDMVTNNNVELEILGAQWGWARYYEIMKASVGLFAMGGMPSIESALLGAFPIAIEQQPTKDLPEFDKFMEYNFGNSMPIFKHNQAKEAAAKIDEALAKPQGHCLSEYQTVSKFMSGGTNVTPSFVNAKHVIKRMEKYLESI